MYDTKRLKAEIQVEDYVREYVDLPTFLEKCKECPNYEKIWSCPPFLFDAKQYWEQYKKLKLYGTMILFDPLMRKQKMSLVEQNRIIKEVVEEEKRKLSEVLWDLEEKIPESVSLSAGACSTCGEVCPRSQGRKCIHPDKMRYSIEALGGNVGQTVSNLFHVDLQWMEEGKLPEYFVLVGGLLQK